MASKKELQSPASLNPNALSLSDAARLLTKAGGWPVTEEMVQGDLAAGAPENPDGTINLVLYAAWLVKGMGSGDRHEAASPI